MISALSRLLALLARIRHSRRAARVLGIALLSYPILMATLVMLRRKLRVERVAVHYGPHSSNIRKVQMMEALRTYAPTWWLVNGHLQTVFGALARRTPRGMAFRRELLPLPDGGEVALDWRGTPHPEHATVVVLHGLTGGSHEPYVQWLVHACEERGMQCVVFNARGCGGTKLRTPLGFNAARTGDTEYVLRHVRGRLHEGTPLFAVGVSLGAGLLVKYMGEAGEGCLLDAGAALAASFDFLQTARRLERWFARLTYNRRLALNLVGWLRDQEHAFREAQAAQEARAAEEAPSTPRLDLARAYASRTVREFDASVVVPLFGYQHGVREYYRHASPGQFLPGVRRPLLVVNARDDPIADVSGLEELLGVVNTNSNIVIAITDEGGHVAWCTGSNPLGRSWVDGVVADWFSIHTPDGGEPHPSPAVA